MADESLNYLIAEISKRIEGINSRRVFYRRRAGFFFSATIILTAFNTLVLGLKTDIDAGIIKNIALFVSSILTVLSAYNSYYSYQELWAANNNALNRFYALRFNVDFQINTDKPIALDFIEHMKQEYQAALDDLNQTWVKSRSKNNPPAKKG